jgi:hypothetical protein
MSRRDEHFDAMLRHLGATYYQTRRGEGSAQDVERALESVEDAHRSGGAAGEALAHAGPRARSHRGGRWRVRDVMSTDVVTVGKTTSYKEVARLMNDRHIRRLPVLDASGTLIGIVSRRDLLRVFLRPDTEIGAEVHGVLTSVLLEDPQSVTSPGKQNRSQLTAKLAGRDDAACVRPGWFGAGRGGVSPRSPSTADCRVVIVRIRPVMGSRFRTAAPGVLSRTCCRKPLSQPDA